MKKKILFALALPLILGVSACGSTPKDEGKKDDEKVTPVSKTYDVTYYVDGNLIATEYVKEGNKVPAKIGTPKDGYDFVGWAIQGTTTVLDLETYEIKGDIKLEAIYVEHIDDTSLSVDDVKDATKTYSLVMGWWEVDDPTQPDKITSGFTKSTVRTFYKNILSYLRLKGYSQEVINGVTMRNYSSATVADMGTSINNDADVGLMFGVGNNINSTAKVSLAKDESEEAMKFEADFHTVDANGKALKRYIAAPATTNDLAKEVYYWIKDNESAGMLYKELTDAEIQATLNVVIDLTVTIHAGDVSQSTRLQDKDTAVEWPTYEAPEGKRYKGLGISPDGEVALDVTEGAAIKYADVKTLANDAATLDLYVLFENIPVVTDDLNVYFQLNKDLNDYEVELMMARFQHIIELEALANETSAPNVNFTTVEGDAAAFTDAIGKAENVDIIIGGNNPVKNFAAHEQGALTNVAAKHFVSTNRKIIIYNGTNSSADHLDLAKKFYSFATTEAPVFNYYVTFWTKGGAWITENEENAMMQGIYNSIKEYLHLGEGADLLLETYNVELNYVSLADTKVATLIEKTALTGDAIKDEEEKVIKAIGSDLVVGVGGNAIDSGLPATEMKDVPVSMIAASRKVAKIRKDGLTRHLYDNYFAEAPAEEVTEEQPA